jgi:hypothetical protein
MPGFDRTGPSGEGPRTGRELGKCNPGKDNDLNTEEEDLRGGCDGRFRLGQGWRKGRGRGASLGRRAGRDRGRGIGGGAGRGLDPDRD